MHVSRTLVLCVALGAVVAAASPRARFKRQLADDDSLQPLDDNEGSEQNREKRKLEGVTQAKLGVKNAILGFVFGPGTTSRPPLTRTRTSAPIISNTTPNTMPNQSGFTSPKPTKGTSRKPISRTITGSKEVTSSKKDIITSQRKYSSLDISKPDRLLETRSGLRLPRQTPTTADGIPIFDRNKVSLDVPGSLFGPSVSLLIKSTKIIGEVIQNSAVRYQTFLRLFRPLFRGPFEIKGLDPPTTTTTTTTAKPRTTRTTTEVSASNEVRRRRQSVY